jgi:excisionase family DNA binding protein
MPEDKPLFVRLKAAQAAQLDRASHELNLPKKELVNALVAKHISASQLDELRRVVIETGGETLTVGRADLRPAEPAEVLTLESAADLLQIEPSQLNELAEAGELPGRRIGEDWRFSRAALLAWLAG